MSEERRIGPVRFVPGGNRGKYPFVNCVYVEDAGVLIDTGADRAHLTALREGPGVREVWLSHWHEDHIAGMDLFEDVPFRQSPLEIEPLSGVEAFIDWYGMQGEATRDYWRKALVEEFHYRPRRASGWLQPGEVIDLGSCSVEIIPTPGHTPGHLAFFFREPGVLFMGDYDLTRFGPWYGDRDSSLDDLIASIERLRQVPARVWLTSHETGYFEGDVSGLFARYRAVIDEREAKLLDCLAQPRTFEDIVNQWIVYRKPREPKAFYEWGEGAIMGKHLERLMRSGSVALEEGRYRLAA
jgi:glyoxylase-like metal-dependent hydrolase (beta-lactamase superfamily II)